MEEPVKPNEEPIVPPAEPSIEPSVPRIAHEFNATPTVSEPNVPTPLAVSPANTAASYNPNNPGIKITSITPADQVNLSQFSDDPDTKQSHRFLMAYVVTVFSALILLWSAIFLGNTLFDHFFGPKTDDGFNLIDLAPLYIGVMAAMVTFGVLYLAASRVVAKSVASDSIGLKDWRVYKVMYAVFAALLFVTAASTVASLLYIPLAQLTVSDDLQGKQILVTVLGSIHALAWIALLLWQERLVKHGKALWVQGTVVAAASLLLVILTGVFPIGSKTNDRSDARVASDLQTIETKIGSYQSNHDQALPSSLSALDFKDETVASRLKNYTYTVTADSTDASSVSYPYTSDDSDNNATDGSIDDSSTLGALAGYKLCATFKTDTTDDTTNSIFGNLVGGSSVTSPSSVPYTDHKVGYTCFTRS